MCESIDRAPGTGWRGWPTSGAVRPTTPTGDWIDLTWPLTPGVPRLSSFPPPRIERMRSIPDDPLNVTELSMVVHVGTHVDSPRHFFSDGPAHEEVPLSRLMGPGVVWHLDKPLDGTIEREELEQMRPQLHPGDMLVLDTGIAEHDGMRGYERHASLSAAAAEWLVEQEIKLLAVDMPTPEVPIHCRTDGFDFPVHHALLGNGVLIAELVTNVRTLAGGRAEFLFLGLNIVGGDGAPARVIARPVLD